MIRDIVGRRPAREGGVRLEAETVSVVGKDGQTSNRVVVHAYGAAGRGYEISWGVAEDVKGLLLERGLLQERAAL